MIAAPGIRIALSADAVEIVLLDHLATGDGPRREFIHRSVSAGCCWVAANESGQIAGYGVLEYSFYGHGWVSILYVAGPHRRRGIGTAIMRQIERTCRTPKLFTSTNQSNAPMQALLRKLGFHPSGVIENLDDGDPELVFFKRLSE